MKRTNQEILLLLLSAMTSVAIIPFTAIRFIANDWILGGVDLLVSLCMVVIFFYVYRTRKTQIPGIILSIFTISAAYLSVHIKGANTTYWLYPAIVAAYYLLPRKLAIFITLIVSVLIVLRLYGEVAIIQLATFVSTLLMTSFFGFFFSRNIEEKHKKLTELATKDSLTGVGNRRALDIKLQELVLSQKRKPSTVSLILLDIDNFKMINDEHGHILGDQILIRISQIIEGRIRVTDALYRFGGEEFVIVPLDLDITSTQRLAEQLRTLVENYALIPDNPVTISLGVAEYRQDESYDDWLHRADEALYRAKNSGRNQVCLAE